MWKKFIQYTGQKHYKKDGGKRGEKRKSSIKILPVDDHDKPFKYSLKTTTKNPEDIIELRKAIQDNDFLNTLITGKRLEAIINVMYWQEVEESDIIIQEGEVGSQMFISGEGTYEVILKGNTIDTFDDVRVFGELAIIYNAKRAATVRAKTTGKIWVLDSMFFREIMLRSEMEEKNELISFLQNIPKLNTVSLKALAQVATLLQSEFYPSDSHIVEEGASGDKFYIIKAGSVTVSKYSEGAVATLGKGHFFGELALLKGERRAATVTADAPGTQCLVLNRRDFIAHFGEVEDFSSIRIVHPELKPIEKVEYALVELDDLKVIAMLGFGGFGRVELVQNRNNPDELFALKMMKKHSIKHPEHRQHVFSEKNVQIICDSSFITRLYRTYRDERYLYFLLECCLGGDLWNLMYKHRGKPFNDIDAKFYTACVVEAFTYLHERGIVYRDLKPENLLIGCNGYLKLSDFGFAKKIEDEKTYSFVGTPEYIAPELLQKKSYSISVDYWALGIFIFEILTCKTPFKSYDATFIKTYKMILKGIENVKFPPEISPKAKHLIKMLCKKNPAERLGSLRNGILDIKTHEWFDGLSWQALTLFNIKPPHVPKLSGPLDTKYFDSYLTKRDLPPVDNSGWDEDF